MSGATPAGPGGFTHGEFAHGGGAHGGGRRAVWFLVVIHLILAAYPAFTTITRRPGMSAAEITLIALGAAAAGGLQLRHSLAAARGGRPRGWQLTFVMLVLLADLPFLARGWYTYDWVLEEQWFVVASAVMLLPRRVGRLTAVAAIAAVAIPYTVHDYAVVGFGWPQTVLFGCDYVVIAAIGGIALYGSARLVGILGDLFAARTELAEQALGRERIRMSRDLHDLLGQRLSAVSLKGDLAIRLLAADRPAAVREIDSLTAVARSALGDMRAVTWAEHDVSLAEEVDSAQAVLQATGATVQVAVELASLAPALDAVLAWAVREGAANILRHAQPAAVAISADRQDGRVRLQILNDGAWPAAAGSSGLAGLPGGSGLAGLAERARAVGGSAVGGYQGAGQFRLLVELPDSGR